MRIHINTKKLSEFRAFQICFKINNEENLKQRISKEHMIPIRCFCKYIYLKLISFYRKYMCDNTLTYTAQIEILLK